MHKHWDDHLKVKDLLLWHHPHLLVEIGAGGGDNTRQIIQLFMERGIPEQLVVLSDNAPPTDIQKGLLDGTLPSGIDWIEGVSYQALEVFKDASIDCAILDTDHNGWTLDQELTVLDRVMKHGGLLLLHDIESFRDSDGFAHRYCNNAPYPKEVYTFSKSFGQVYREATHGGHWRIVAESTVEAGAAALLHVRLRHPIPASAGESVDVNATPNSSTEPKQLNLFE